MLLAASLSAQQLKINSKNHGGDVKIADSSGATDILVSHLDNKVAQIAASDLSADIEKITGKRPRLRNMLVKKSSDLVIIGTIGNPLIKALRNLDVSRIQGKWESYIIATVKEPLPGVARALVIVGSDRRGTAFGTYEFSKMLGVSPWHWWADVTPEKRASISVSRGIIYSNEPSVKYRGIFLNDEDWGLQPWAAKTYEPETGNIGPKTYARIFELLLRLKANTLWPAMHEVTSAFNSIPGNAQTADDYAIVMGSSHAEPMLRNNVGEWKAPKEDYNFITNQEGVTAYWEERAKANGGFENVYTLGMRGIHDSPIQGTKNQAERIPVLEKIISTQRGLLEKYSGKQADDIPQIFCPYKEVLSDYRAGLNLPDDVTIVFPDDNFGYIRQFPTAEESKRVGGFGVYYHISYLGRPMSYLWLNTTPPALIWEEMSKAYENGMQQFWVVNVGDIKPSEIGMEFFLQMAYDIKKWRRDNLPDYLRAWAAREFGAKHGKEIATIMDGYYRLGYARKPEHLQWYLPNETPRPSDLTNEEKLERYFQYLGLRRKAEALDKLLPNDKKDAFFELVLYPVRSAALANERLVATELANELANEGKEDAAVWARRAIAANETIVADTRYFNETLAGGKWRGIMTPEMGAGQWPSMRNTLPKLTEAAQKAAKDISNTNKRLIARPVSPMPPKKWGAGATFIESNGAISFEAEHYTRKTGVSGATWEVISGLGRSGDSVAVFPTTAKTADPPEAPALEYDFNALSGGPYEAVFYLLPTQPLVAGTGLRYAVAIDDLPPQTITVGLDAEVSSPKWAQNVLNAATTGTLQLELPPGKHTLKIFMVDAGVVLDKIVLRKKGVELGYLGPPETATRR